MKEPTFEEWLLERFPKILRMSRHTCDAGRLVDELFEQYEQDYLSDIDAIRDFSSLEETEEMNLAIMKGVW